MARNSRGCDNRGISAARPRNTKMPKPKTNHVKVTLRTSRDLWQRLQWLAEAEDATRQDVVRRVLRDAVKDVQPPNGENQISVVVPDEDLATLHNLAEDRGLGIEDLASTILARVIANARATE